MGLSLSLNTNPLVNRFAEPDDLIDTIARDIRIRDIQLTHEFINPGWPASVIRRMTRDMDRALQRTGARVTSGMTGPYGRLNHFGHPDREVRRYYVDWFKSFADIIGDLGGVSVGTQFASRGWFIMLEASGLLFVALYLAASRFGRIRLGPDDARPEFSTPAWIAMLFAAGIGVGLLFYGAAEPLTHFDAISAHEDAPRAAGMALFVTYLNWGLHAWAIYGVVGLVIAYFAFRRGRPLLLSAPLIDAAGDRRWTRMLGWAFDLLAIVALALTLFVVEWFPADITALIVMVLLLLLQLLLLM